MSDALTHECGLAFVRLRKPISWFQQERSDPLWGLRKLYLLMEKQHNRGQDGAGIACVKFDMPPGDAFLERERTASICAAGRLPVRAAGRRCLDLTPTALKRLAREIVLRAQREEFLRRLEDERVLRGHVAEQTHLRRAY